MSEREISLEENEDGVDREWLTRIDFPEFGFELAIVREFDGKEGECVVVKSTDYGKTWKVAAEAPYSQWHAIELAEELEMFVAIASRGDVQVMTSPDGETWTERKAPDGYWETAAWSPKLKVFAVVGWSNDDNKAMTSPDGINWTSSDAPNGSWDRLKWSHERDLFIAEAWMGMNREMTSPDGVTWTVTSRLR